MAMISHVCVVRLQRTLLILASEIERKDSSLDFPVMFFVNWMIPMISVSGVGLLMFLLETLEMLMNPKSEIAESKVMKEGEVELGEETFRIVMLLFDEIGAVDKIVIAVATERSWMWRWQFVIGVEMVIEVVAVPTMESEISKIPCGEQVN